LPQYIRCGRRTDDRGQTDDNRAMNARIHHCCSASKTE